MKKKLYVGNLLYKITKEELFDLFSPFGEVEEAIIITDRDTGRSKGFGFVTFVKEEAAEAALSMNEKEIEGKKVVVNVAKPQEKRGGGGSGGRGGRGGFGGGRGGFGGAGRGGFGGGDRY